jgi:hypothetical protein
VEKSRRMMERRRTVEKMERKRQVRRTLPSAERCVMRDSVRK